jgi:hypothetical protein
MIHGLTYYVRWLQRCAGLALLFAIPCPHTVLAQQQPPPPAAPPIQQQPAPPPVQQQKFPQSPEWSNLPKMQLERQFAGPLQDTVIQRLRDPVDGTICYLYLPISAPHSPTTASGFVQYGPNTIGTINCVPGAAAGRAPAARK